MVTLSMFKFYKNGIFLCYVTIPHTWEHKYMFYGGTPSTFPPSPFEFGDEPGISRDWARHELQSALRNNLVAEYKKAHAGKSSLLVYVLVYITHTGNDMYEFIPDLEETMYGVHRESWTAPLATQAKSLVM